MSDKKNAVVYDENKIKTLSSLEHIQTRPGMYVGRLGNGSHPDDGIYILVKEVVDNCIDEFIMGHGRKVEVAIEEQQVTVRDYGRGIPLGKLIDCVSRINTGAKYNDDVFQFSVGLNGVGLKAVNALSKIFIACAVRDGKQKLVEFHDGVLVREEDSDSKEPNGTIITFTPGVYFKNFSFEDKYLSRRFWHNAYLNSGLSIYFKGNRYYSKQGLFDLLSEKVEGEKTYDIVYHKDTQLEFAFCHTSSFGETYYSFVNGQFTNDGGTHQSAFREGILKGVNEFAGKNFNGADVRNGITGTIAIKLKEPLFESQTKNKLGNSEIRGEIVSKVKDVVTAYLYKNSEMADQLLQKIDQNAKIRIDIQNVKKGAKDKAKKAAIKIPKLRDCKYHLNTKNSKGADSMLFLTEGQSAAGSMLSCRNVDNQAIFSLKGKPPNVFGHKIKAVYKNDELFFMMKAIGIEDGIEDLRYEKVIIATDADVDGLHIRNLLLTYFLTFFEQLVLAEHVFILETPIFRVRNKKETFYCYDDVERDQAIAKLGKNHEITRFKGLGEISPKEFEQFIGENMRLLPVTVDSMHSLHELLEFYMGKNTPSRRDYIMANLR